jgi:hypothetical protein
MAILLGWVDAEILFEGDAGVRLSFQASGQGRFLASILLGFGTRR